MRKKEGGGVLISQGMLACDWSEFYAEWSCSWWGRRGRWRLRCCPGPPAASWTVRSASWSRWRGPRPETPDAVRLHKQQLIFSSSYIKIIKRNTMFFLIATGQPRASRGSRAGPRFEPESFWRISSALSTKLHLPSYSYALPLLLR